MVVNETIQTAKEVSQMAYNSSLGILFIAFVVLLPLIALFYKKANNSHKWGDFWGIYLFTIVIVGIVLAFLVSAPDLVSSSVIKLKEIFG